MYGYFCTVMCVYQYNNFVLVMRCGGPETTPSAPVSRPRAPRDAPFYVAMRAPSPHRPPIPPPPRSTPPPRPAVPASRPALPSLPSSRRAQPAPQSAPRAERPATMANLAGKMVVDSTAALRGAGGGRARGARVATRAAVEAPSKQELRQPRPENVPGEFYVDHTCIGARPLSADQRSYAGSTLPFLHIP